MTYLSVVAAIVVVFLFQARDVQSVSHCPDGRAALDHVFCGLGGGHCPHGYFCNVAPNDAYAECCPTHCGNTMPLLDTHDRPVYCGRGGVRCPDTHTCKIAPNDAWAVCCMK